MKSFTTTLVAIFGFFSLVHGAAIVAGTNAERFARHLPPKSPVRLYDPTVRSAAHYARQSPSSGCTMSETHECCLSLIQAGDSSNLVIIAAVLSGLLDGNAVIGLNCQTQEETCPINLNLFPACCTTPLLELGGGIGGDSLDISVGCRDISGV
ncbi:hypothetical protein FRB99_000701 [Tulasnella sp. 403]|nr:hypothetical protein FRB99_000701 [Tulasnella sp. 403]